MRLVGDRRAVVVLMTTLLVLLALVAAVVTGCADDPPPTRTIAFLRAVPASDNEAVFLPSLAELGFPRERLRVLGADEVHAEPEAAEAAVRRWVDDGADLVVALSTGSAQAAARVTSTVPILFLLNDPRVAGLVDDERRPERNLTGGTYRVPADRVLALALITTRLGITVPESILARADTVVR